MHKYLRAIGFSEPPKRREIYDIIVAGIANNPSYRAFTSSDVEEDSLLAQYNIEMGRNFGLTVCGQFDDDDQFFPEYYYPYISADFISSTEQPEVERRMDNESYAGVCDDLRVGMTLIFRLQNAIEYIKSVHTSFAPLDNTSVSLSGLCLSGTVMLPIYKTEQDRRNKKNNEVKRRRLMNAARGGDEEAMKNLTVEEMDIYSNILSHIQYEDVFSLVDSYFMPYGAECELYSIMGEIVDCRTFTNTFTGENVVELEVDCNGLQLRVAINEKDLYGEPKPGRRFKGVIWLQGKINFPTGGDMKM